MSASLTRSIAPQPESLFLVTRRTTARLLERSGLAQRCFRRNRGLRILCYHGVCADELHKQPWVPSYFVAASAFAEQMAIVQRFGRAAFLPDVIEQLAAGSYPGEAAFAVTFDDVAACSFALARPILAQAGLRASFFVSTGHVATGRLFNADVLRLLRCQPDLLDSENLDLIAWLLHTPGQHKQLPLEHLRAPLNRAEQTVRARLAPNILETLRPMNWDEVQQLAAEGHEIGGHTVNHVNLGWQADEVRRREVVESVSELERRLKHKITGFAYPNGGPGDFAAQDTVTLRELGVRYAVSTRAGFARNGDLFALPRVCIGVGHTAERFMLEISGVFDRRRRRQHGWS